MKLKDIYSLAIEMGISADPRGKEGVAKVLANSKKEYKELSDKKKKLFDVENLNNPYSDTRVLYGDMNREVKKVLAGIDADGAEVLLADRLTEKAHLKGSKQGGIDLVISHHPTGHALASLDEVMDVQVDMYAQAGVPENIAHALFEERKSLVKRGIGPLNHAQAVDIAKLLDIPIMAIHTVWDNLGNDFMNKNIENKKFDSLEKLLDAINDIPEFTEAVRGKCPPAIVAGGPKSRTGRVVVSFTGGTNPSKQLYIELGKAGVGTVVEMHVPEDAVQALRKMHVNVIDAGHMAADSIGANLFLDELEKRGVEVIPCSGLIRVKRDKGAGNSK
jgi:putative NIF3 family GTP cyclohydrolase 1 type 2